MISSKDKKLTTQLESLENKLHKKTIDYYIIDDKLNEEFV
jgi:hypothetical protein